MSHIKDFQHLKIPLEAIKSATTNFAAENLIGRGGFGRVYKGEVVHLSHSIVAIKRLDRAYGQGNPEFWKEVTMLFLYRHENIVSLLGFCDESDEKILVYEYASRRSLDLYLNSNHLSGIQRLNICIGAARGLAYLHSAFNGHTRVLHRDIKSSNILLDENWNPKISDFGLSKFGPANQQFTFLFSHVVGTIGYCDPLYLEIGLLTKESDVYSFCVVLFEVLCGRLCMDDSNDNPQPLTRLARKMYDQKKINEIVFNNIKDEINPNYLEAFTSVAYRCTKINHEERPLMQEVVTILESALEYQVDEGSLKLFGMADSFQLEVYKLEEESCCFNKKYFGDKIVAGEWDEVERYLKRFTKIDDNRYSMKTFFEIRKHKYLEALDRNEQAKAVEILKKDMKIFSTFNDELFKEITLLITLDNFREHDVLSKYEDMITARHILVREMIKLIDGNPLINKQLDITTPAKWGKFYKRRGKLQGPESNI